MVGSIGTSSACYKVTVGEVQKITRASSSPPPAQRGRSFAEENKAEICVSLRRCLEGHGFDSVVASSMNDATARCSTGADLLLLGCPLYGSGAVSSAPEFPARAPKSAVIIMADPPAPAHGKQSAVSLPRPFDPHAVLDAVSRVLALRDARRSDGKPCPEADVYSFERIIGDSPPMQRTKALLRRIAASPVSTVLLTGESGTGKGLASRAIHFNSERSREQFVNITCSALPETLLESELFGHERGAFTDAKEQKLGLLEIADRGSVFLDEIGELSHTLQVKLLRFLEERAFRRVGGAEDIVVDVRIIAATNRDLRAEVDAGRFREDLFYRLSVVPIEIPALRERSEDIPALAEYYIGSLNRDLGRAVKGMTAEAEQLLRAHDWPGNVRELRNVIERAMLLTDEDWLQGSDFQDLPATADLPPPGEIRLPPQGVDLEVLEKSLLSQALARTGWNKTRAAKLLGLNRDQIRYRISKYALAAEPEFTDR